MTVASAAYRKLATSARADLVRAFDLGEPPAVENLLGYEYRGYNHTRSAELLRIRKFIKVFYPDADGRPFGCNTPVKQNGLEGEWLPRPSAERPKRYAFFKVTGPDPAASDPFTRGGLLLDYGRGGNKPYDVARILRDYLVRVDPGSDELLLGTAFFVLGGRRLARTFFVIERRGPIADADVLGARRG